MFRASIVGLLVILLAIIVACGEEATPTEGPDAAPAPAKAAIAPSPSAAPAPEAAATTQAAGTVATPTAAPVTAPVQSPTAMVEATGSLGFAVPELAPLISDLANMPYGVFRFLNNTTHESMWDTNIDNTL